MANSQELTAILEVNNLIVGYEQRVLVHNLFFALPEPAFVAVIGHNGAGKTTLFKALLGQLPYQGNVTLLGKEVREQSTKELAALRGYLPQKSELRFPVTVTELVVMGRFRFKRLFDPYNQADYHAVTAQLQKLGIAHLADRNAQELSGGELQLVWLAQLALQEAQVLFLDEPAQQLDVYNKGRVYSQLQRWVNEENRTVLCTTHDLLYLTRLEGYLLNLSHPEPALEPISAESVDRHLHFLEQGPAFSGPAPAAAASRPRPGLQA